MNTFLMDPTTTTHSLSCEQKHCELAYVFNKYKNFDVTYANNLPVSVTKTLTGWEKRYARWESRKASASTYIEKLPHDDFKGYLTGSYDNITDWAMVKVDASSEVDDPHQTHPFVPQKRPCAEETMNQPGTQHKKNETVSRYDKEDSRVGRSRWVTLLPYHNASSGPEQRLTWDEATVASTCGKTSRLIAPPSSVTICSVCIAAVYLPHTLMIAKGSVKVCTQQTLSLKALHPVITSLCSGTLLIAFLRMTPGARNPSHHPHRPGTNKFVYRSSSGFRCSRVSVIMSICRPLRQQMNTLPRVALCTPNICPIISNGSPSMSVVSGRLLLYRYFEDSRMGSRMPHLLVVSSEAEILAPESLHGANSCPVLVESSLWVTRMWQTSLVEYSNATNKYTLTWMCDLFPVSGD